MAVYQRGENWYIDFNFKGHRIRESIGPSRKDAEKVIAKKKTDVIENKYLDIREEPELVSFYDFAKEYLESVKEDKKPSNYQRLLSLMRQVNREFETKIIQEITAQEIEKYKGKRKKQVKPATINREVALLKHMFTKALEWGRLKENPAKKVKLLDGEVERVRYLMPDEIKTLLSKCDDFLRPIVIVAVNTGLRKGELFSLRWRDINFEVGIISILKTNTKNKTRKDIPMNKAVTATLTGMSRRGQHVFCKEDGAILKYSSVRKSFGKAVRKSGIEDFRFHDLRHSFASNLVMAGVDILIVQQLMGHKDLKMTLRYSHLSPAYKAKAVTELDKRFALDERDSMSQNPPHQDNLKKEEWANA